MNTMIDDNEFKAIRPYRDHELKQALERLGSYKEFSSILEVMTGRHYDRFKRDNPDITPDNLRERFKSITSVEQFQVEIIINLIIKPLIKYTTDGVTYSGIEQLKTDEAYLYITNHRDIAVDASLLTYCLHVNNHNTIEIAFGDNLLISDFISDLIRINKSFIVKRDLPMSEQIAASIELARYVYSRLMNYQSLWIAQRSGRAKDGDDSTNPAIITMLHLSQRESGMPLNEFINKIKIVPVTISYEFDPCDRMKALEIYNTQKNKSYVKTKADDLGSMTQGLSGYKGRVHYSFMKPLGGNFKNNIEVAAAIDREIQLNYMLRPNNYIAHDELHQTSTYRGMYSDSDRAKFFGRFKAIVPDIKKIIYAMYAQPVINFEKQKSK